MTLVYENIMLALSSLKANKMRAMLTMLGIIIGISAVIAIMTIGNSLQASVSSSMASMGVNNISVYMSPKDNDYSIETDDMKFGQSDIIAMGNKYSDKIKAVSVTQTVGSGKIQMNNSYANVSVVGISNGYFCAQQTQLPAGSRFTGNDYKNGTHAAIVSDRLVKNLFGGSNDAALGKNVEVCLDNDYISYTIVGVYKYQKSDYDGGTAVSSKDTSTDLLIPLKTAQNQTHTSSISDFTVVGKEGTDCTALGSSISQFLIDRLPKDTKFTVSAYSNESYAKQTSNMLSTLTLAISVIAGIALLVGGIGVMNIMMVSITERTREIGTRKALGAPNSYIMLQFIVEAVIICLLGGVIGIVFGIIIGTAASTLMGYAAKASALSILVSLGFSMAIGVFFGYYPASKAAHMNPIEALRYE